MPSNTSDNAKSTKKNLGAIQQSNGFITVWSLRALLQLNILDRFIERFGGFNNAEALQSIGLNDFYVTDADAGLERLPAKRQAVKKQLHERLALLNKASHASVQDDIFSSGIGLLKKSLSLSKADVELLHFATIAHVRGGHTVWIIWICLHPRCGL